MVIILIFLFTILLVGSSYIKLPEELRNSRKDIINIQNQDNEYFQWCYIRHLNPIKKFFRKLINLTKNGFESLL